MSALLLALTLAASPSTKLGVHVVGEDATSQTLLAAPVCPGLTVFPLPGVTTTAAQVAAFRIACPGSFVVAQVGTPGMPVALGTASANWLSNWLILLNTIGMNNFDAVEGPSNPTGLAADVAAFWSEFAGLVQAIPKLPIVGSLATGTPSTSFCPTADAMVLRGGSWAWSYHAFSTGLTQDVATESSTTFGYRAIRNACGSVAGKFIYLTQAGRAAGAWTTADVSWLSFLDAQLAQDAEVVGAALFEAGGTDRSLSPIVPQLAALLQGLPAPDGGTPDGGTDAGQTGIAHSSNFAPTGPPATYPSSGCASAGAGAGLAMLVLVTTLLLRRRRDRDTGN